MSIWVQSVSLLSFLECHVRFTRGLLHALLLASGSLTLPCLSRVGGFTGGRILMPSSSLFEVSWLSVHPANL